MTITIRIALAETRVSDQRVSTMICRYKPTVQSHKQIENQQLNGWGVMGLTNSHEDHWQSHKVRFTIIPHFNSFARCLKSSNPHPTLTNPCRCRPRTATSEPQSCPVGRKTVQGCVSEFAVKAQLTVLPTHITQDNTLN